MVSPVSLLPGAARRGGLFALPAAALLACLLSAASLALLGPEAAYGADPLGQFRDWRAWREQESGGPVCYAVSNPTKAEGDYAVRGDIFSLVSHRPRQQRIGEVSFVAGYDFKEASEAEVQVGGRSFRLFTRDGAAWTFNSRDDTELVAAMKRAGSMVVLGTSSRGTKTRDTYSLYGFTDAFEAAAEACGL